MIITIITAAILIVAAFTVGAMGGSYSALKNELELT
jgi:hypothetical protein